MSSRVAAARRALEGALRAHPFAVVLALLCAAYLGPLWWFSYPAMLDYPAHLVMSRQLREVLVDAQAADWRLMPLPWPNLLFATLDAGLQSVVDANVGGKLLVSGAIVATPLSVAMLLRRFGLPIWGALLSLPLLCPLLDLGLVPYVLSVPLAIVAIAVAPSISTLPRMLAFSGLCTLAYAAHIGGFVLLGPPAVLTALVMAKGPRWPARLRTALFAGLGYAIPAVLFCLPWVIATIETRWHAQGAPEVFLPLLPLRTARSVLAYNAWLSYGWEQRALVLVAIAGLAGLLALPAERRYDWRRLVPAASAALLGFALPSSAGETVYLGERLLCVAAMLAALWIPPQTRTRAGRVHLALLVVLMLAHAGLRNIKWYDFDDEVKQLRLLARSIPRNSRVLFELRSAGRDKRPDELDSWHMALIHDYLYYWRGTYSNLFPSQFGTSVVQSKEGRLHPLIAEKFLNGRAFDDEHDPRLATIPYVLNMTMNEPPVRKLGAFAPTMRAGLATLYRNVRHEQAPITLPAVADACPYRTYANATVAGCRHELRWIDAVESCKAWGGELTRKVPRQALLGRAHWIDLSDRGYFQHELGSRGRRIRYGPDLGRQLRRCALVSDGEIEPTRCNRKARALCQAEPRFDPPQTALPLQLLGVRHALLLEPMTFDDAARACKKIGGRMVDVAGKRVQLLALSLSDPIWLDLIKPSPRAEWQSSRGKPAPLALEELRSRHSWLCGAMDGEVTLHDCRELRPFFCIRHDR